MTSRKDFEAVAAAIRTARADMIDNAAAGYDEGYDCGVDVATHIITDQLAVYFATQNPNFDHDRFVEACLEG